MVHGLPISLELLKKQMGELTHAAATCKGSRSNIEGKRDDTCTEQGRKEGFAIESIQLGLLNTV